MTTTSHVAEQDASTVPPPENRAVAYGVRVGRGSIVNVAVQLATVGITFLVNLVLSWFLDPADFGLLALANSWIVIAGVFRDAGASRILVQRQDEFTAVARTVFVLALAASLTCGLVTVAATPLLVHFYHTPALGPVLLISALRLPLGAMGAVSGAKLTIDMRWRALGIVQLGTIVVSSAASVLLARLGWGVYALIVPQTAADGLRAVWLWHSAKLPALQPFSKATAKMLLASSGFLMASGLLFALRSQGDYVALGLTRSTTETGQYFMAFNIAALGARLLMGGLAPVLFTVFAKVSTDRARQEAMLKRVFHTLVCLLLLATALQATLAWPLFRLVLAPKWANAATFFAILSTVHLLVSLNSVIVQPVQAAGLYGPVFVFDIVFAPFELSMFVAGALIAGPLGVSIFAAISALIGFLSWYTFSCRLLKFSLTHLFGPLWRPLVALVPLAAIGVAANRLFPAGKVGDLCKILIVALFGSGAYLACIWILWRPVLEDVANLIGQSLGRSAVGAARASGVVASPPPSSVE